MVAVMPLCRSQCSVVLPALPKVRSTTVCCPSAVLGIPIFPSAGGLVSKITLCDPPTVKRT